METTTLANRPETRINLMTLIIRHSKFLSLVLRHQPEKIGLTLDSGGWADVDDLLRKCNEHGKRINRTTLLLVVAENNKKRFALSEDGHRIRASQGHSIPVDLGIETRTPPPNLFHGTATRFLDSILEQGLLKQRRTHVHLSANIETAVNVGSRHGKPVILEIASGAMHNDGHLFWLSDNQVWLAEHIPTDYLRVMERNER